AKQPASIIYGRFGPQLDWVDPDGSPQEHVNGDMASGQPDANGLIPVDYAVAVAGQNHLFVWYKNDGATYGGAHGFQCQGGQWRFRDVCSYMGSVPTACAQVRATGPLQSATGGPPDPAPLIKAQLASISGEVNGGTVGTSPSDPSRQYTFLPSCFWLTGSEKNKAFELRVQDPTVGAAGTPDGRAITYVYRINVGLQNVHWDYGDGASREGVVGTPWSPAAPDACSNEHTYERISVRANPGTVACPAAYPHSSMDDACYEVRVRETYAVSVTAYWYDGAGPHAPVEMGTMSPLTLTPPSTFVRIQQIEGVPTTR
ncbi:MAG: hypothetical protein ABR573_02275, partial [Candidatus Dormibacteria bacterium]